jgi:transposase
VETDWTTTATAQETPSAESGAETEGQSVGTHRDIVCPQDRHPLGVLAPRDGMRIGYDVLAATARLARGGRVGENSLRVVATVGGRRANRLVTGHRGQHVRTGGFWGAQTGPNPTDRRKPGSKHHVLTDANGIPLATTLTGANAHDVTQLIPLVDAIPNIRGKRGKRRRPKRVQGDRAYDSEPHRQRLRRRGIRPVLAKRYTEHGSGLGVFRWVVERTNSWLHQFRRLRVRFERRPDIHEAFLTLGCILICFRTL